MYLPTAPTAAAGNANCERVAKPVATPRVPKATPPPIIPKALTEIITLLNLGYKASFYLQDSCFYIGTLEVSY